MILRAIAVALLILSGCSRSSSSYYPVDIGRWWYFQTETTILDETYSQRYIVSNVENGEFNGQPIIVQRQASGREVYVGNTSDGIVRLGTHRQEAGGAAESPVIILPNARDVGTTWSVATRLRLIESRTFARQDKLRNRDLPFEMALQIASKDETVTVPAGVFERCLRIDGVGERTVRTDRGNATATVRVEHHEWYAPGVGLVKSTRDEVSESPFLKPGRFRQELLNYE